MKRILNPSEFTYTPSTNQIDFTGVSAFAARNLLAVINITTEKLIYSVASGLAGYGGSFAGSVLTYDSSNAGQNVSDILQIIYDDPAGIQNVSASGTVNSQVYDYNGNGITGIQDPATSEYFLAVDSKSRTNAADGTPIYATYDSQSGEDGLNVNLLNSSFGGQLGSALPIPNNNNALSVGFLNGSVLSAPRMDPVTNELIVQSSPVPMQDVNIAQVNGNAFAGINLPVTVDGFGGSGVFLGQNTRANSIPVVLASDQSPVPITATSPIEVTETVSNIDILGADIVGQRNNQIELSFNTVPSSGITISTSGGASATASNGHTIFATGTTAGAAAVSGTTTLTTSYRAGHEVYCMFTAAFLNLLSNAVAIGQIGLLDSGENNGFTIGIFNGLFGIASYFNATPTLVYSNNFNTDLLNGGSTSKFTRDGAPEAIDLTKSNLFRIRFAWLGSGNIFFEVFSPDAEWVLFHNIRQPNSSYNPSLTTPDLPMRVRVTKGSGTTNASIASACWAAGTTSDVGPLSSTITDATQAKMVRAVIEGKTTGGGGGYVPVKVNPSGALAVEATLSGTSATNISQYGGTSTTLGQKVSASSMPVVIASDQSNVNSILPDLYITGAPNSSAGNNNLLAVAGPGELDVSGYKSAAVQVISAATSGTFIFEGSNSTTSATFQAIPAFRLDSASPNAILTAITATSSNFIYIIPIRYRYMRMRVVTGLSTTVTALTRLSQDPHVSPISQVINATAANLNATVAGALTSVGTVTTVTGVTTVTTVSNVNSCALNAAQTTDIGSAAITTTQTSANINSAQTQGASYAVYVTAISGAGAAMDVAVQETMNGTDYYTVYTFERITAIGQYYSPPIKNSGSGVRYVRTVSGTTPSITNSVNRVARSGNTETIRRFINRTIDPNTLNSNTGSFFCDGVEDFNLIVRCTAQTTAATIDLQFSTDGTNWFTSSATVTTVVGIVQAKIDNMQFKFVRATVTAAGTGITVGEVTIGGHSA